MKLFFELLAPVFVQLEADSAEGAIELFSETVGRDARPHIVGSVWQQLTRDECSGKRAAAYDFCPGGLDG